MLIILNDVSIPLCCRGHRCSQVLPNGWPILGSAIRFTSPTGANVSAAEQEANVALCVLRLCTICGLQCSTPRVYPGAFYSEFGCSGCNETGTPHGSSRQAQSSVINSPLCNLFTSRYRRKDVAKEQPFLYSRRKGFVPISK